MSCKHKYGEVEEEIHAFWNLELDWGERSVSRWLWAWVGSSIGLKEADKQKISDPSEIEPQFPDHMIGTH